MNSRIGLTDRAVRAGGFGRARARRFSPAQLLALEMNATVWAAVAGAAIVVLIAAPLLATLNIWVDEAFTLHTTGAGPLAAWAQAIAFEGQPPLYFLLESVWREFDESSIAFARLPSLLFAASAVATMVFAARRMAPRLPSMLVALTCAINPLVIWAALEMRVYALVLLIGAVLCWTFYEGFLVDRPVRSARRWYVLCAVAGLYTQYYVGFVLAAQLIALLVLRPNRDLRAMVVALALVGLGFAPFTGVVLTHVAGSGDFVERVSALHATHAVFDALFVFVLPHAVDWSGPLKWAGFTVAATLVVGLIAAGRPRALRAPIHAMVVSWVIAVGIFAIVFARLGLPLDPLRHLIVLAPPSLLAGFLFIDSLSRRRRIAGIVAATVFALFALTQLCTQYRAPAAKLGDWQRVAATLAAADPSIPVAVFPAELAFPLSWYLPRATLPIPKPMPFTTAYVGATTLTGTADVARALGGVSRAADVWIVTSGSCPAVEPANYNYHCRYLQAYLDARYRLVRSVAFRGSLARLYARRAIDSARGSQSHSSPRTETPA